jgi:pimeloyl-ACP methyl ester carboxylesterase
MELQPGTFAWTIDGQPAAAAYDEAGSGPGVLLLPALSSISTRAELYPLAARLAAGRRLVLADWPGFGTVPAPATALRPEHLQAFLAAFVAARFDQPPAIVAAGHAAAYALDLAASRPGAVARIALVAPTWRGPLPTVAGGYRRWQERVADALRAPLLGTLLYRANVTPPVVRMMLRGHVLAEPAHLTPDLLAAKRPIIERPNGRFGTAAFVTGGLDLVRSRAAFHDLVRRAGMPLAVLYGPDTPPRSRAEMEALAALPGLAVHRLARGALGVHEEYPDAVAAALAGFLADAPSSPAAPESSDPAIAPCRPPRSAGSSSDRRNTDPRTPAG